MVIVEVDQCIVCQVVNNFSAPLFAALAGDENHIVFYSHSRL